MDIHVVPNEHDQWSVEDRASTAEPIVGTYPTQKEAEAAGRLVLSQQGGGGVLTLHGQDGKVRGTVHVEAD